MTSGRGKLSTLLATATFAAVWGCCWLISCWVQAPYFTADFVVDAVYYNLELGCIALGRMGWQSYLLANHGGYWHVLWKVHYYLLWNLFGLHATAWHLVLGAWHALSAAALFVLVRRNLGQALPAMVAAVVWTTAAIGGYDSPLLCITSGEQAVAVALFLIAMLGAAQMTGDFPRVSLVAILVASVASVATWQLAIVLQPAIALQIWNQRSAASSTASRRGALIAWMVLFAVMCVSFVPMLILERTAQGDLGATAPAGSVVSRFVASLAEPAAHLLGWDVAAVQLQQRAKAAAAALLLAAALASGAAPRRLVVTFLVAALCYATALVSFRADRDILDGRYWYIPTLLWAVAAGAIADGLRRLAARRQFGLPVLVLAIVFVLVAGAWHQRSIARQSRQRFDELFAVTLQARRGYVELIEQLAASGRRRGHAQQVPDVPIEIPPDFQFVWYPLSAFGAIYAPEASREVDFLTPQQAIARDRSSLVEPLEAISSPTAQRIVNELPSIAADWDALIWLQNWAAREQLVVSMPDFLLDYSGLRIQARHAVQLAFDLPLTRLQFAPLPQISLGDIDALHERLLGEHDPRAQRWRDFLLQVRAAAAAQNPAKPAGD